MVVDTHVCNAVRSWMAIYWVSFAIWNTFPVAWLIGHLLPPPADLIGEVLVMIANFMAKVGNEWAQKLSPCWRWYVAAATYGWCRAM